MPAVSALLLWASCIAFHQLTGIGSPAPQAVPKKRQAQAKSSQKAVRLRAVRMLAASPPSDYTASLTLLHLLTDADPSIRRVALTRLKQHPSLPVSAAPVVARLLDCRTPEVQVFAIDTLNWMILPAEQNATRLLELLKSSAPTVRSAALRACYLHVRDRTLLRASIRSLLKDPDPHVRAQAASLYVKPAPRSNSLTTIMLSVLLKRLQNPSPQQRARAVSALGQISSEDPAIVAALIPLTRDADNDVRNIATLVLSTQRSVAQPVVEAMAARLQDKDVDIRSTAAFYFSVTPGDFTTAAPQLLQLVKTPRQKAPVFQGRNPTNFVVADTDARNYAFCALGIIAVKDDATRAQLQTLLSTPVASTGDCDSYPPLLNGPFEALCAASETHPELTSPLLDSLAKSSAEARPTKLALLLRVQRNNVDAWTQVTAFFRQMPLSVRQDTVFRCGIIGIVDVPLSAQGYPTLAPPRTPYAMNWLKSLLHDSDSKIREYAGDAITQAFLPNGQAIQPLLGLLKDTNPQVRKSGIYNLLTAIGKLIGVILIPPQGQVQSREAIENNVMIARGALTKLNTLPPTDAAALADDGRLQRLIIQVDALNSGKLTPVPIPLP